MRAVLEQRGFGVVSRQDPAYWAMAKGHGFPIMVPKQDWPIADDWLREILKDAGISDGDFRDMVAGMLQK